MSLWTNFASSSVSSVKPSSAGIGRSLAIASSMASRFGFFIEATPERRHADDALTTEVEQLTPFELPPDHPKNHGRLWWHHDDLERADDRLSRDAALGRAIGYVADSPESEPHILAQTKAPRQTERESSEVDDAASPGVNRVASGDLER